MLARRTHARPFSLALGLLLCLVTGCGSSTPTGNGLASKSPSEIVAAAKAAAAGAATVHVAGSVLNEGKPIALDMELVAGKGGKGHITVEGCSIDLVQVNAPSTSTAAPPSIRHLARCRRRPSCCRANG